MTEQEKMLWELQKITQEEQQLRKKKELQPLVGVLKEQRERITHLEIELQNTELAVKESEKQMRKLEREANDINSQVQDCKERLYQNKGSSLKELLGLQQSMLKMQTDAEKKENQYWEETKNTEEHTEKVQQIKESLKQLKREYNKGVVNYQQIKQELEIKLAEKQLKQEEIKSLLSEELLSCYEKTKKRFPFNPVAIAAKGMCSGCNIGLSEYFLRTVKEAKKVYYCENCGRIIINA